MVNPVIQPTAESFYFPGGSTGCLLVHGLTGTPKEMRELGKSLAQRGNSVLGVRLFGHATKPEDLIRARWSDWMASIEDGWEILSGTTERIYLIGLSLGGVLSLTFGAQYPVAGIVAMATPYKLPNDPRLPFVKLISLLKPFNSKGPSEWYDQKALEQHACYPVDVTRAYAELDALMREMRKVLPQVCAPTLLIYSQNDPVVKQEDNHMESIYDAISSPDKRKLWIENSGHVITRDLQREVVFEATANFISGR
jgi:carboxylesterase